MVNDAAVRELSGADPGRICASSRMFRLSTGRVESCFESTTEESCDFATSTIGAWVVTVTLSSTAATAIRRFTVWLPPMFSASWRRSGPNP